MTTPEDLKYTRDHEWVRVQGDNATVGITDFAAKQLGDCVYVELRAVGDDLAQGEPFGSIESVKAVSEVFMPVGGKVKETNESVSDSPELINEDPYGDGWLIKTSIADRAELKSLMSAAQYERYKTDEEG